MKRRLRNSISPLVLLGCMIAHPVWGQSEDTTPAKPVAKSDAATPALMKITEIEGISEYKLDNGVRVLLFPDDSKEVVTVNMTVFVGSRHEGYGEAGMAHLLEHMLFKGTPDNPNVPKVLQDRGARFNGTTWVDRTNYYETLPASDENLEFALKLEADRLLNSFIRGEDLESEMTVVRNEFERGENSPFRILMQRMQSVAFDWHNYGKSTIGNRSDIERVPVVNLRQFYRKYYRPDNIMVIVAGKFNPETATTMIGEIFGSLESPDTPIDPTYTTEPAQDGERTVVLRRVGDVQLVGTTYHIPSGSHPEFAAAKALSIVLGDEPSGRLYQGLVESEMASNVFALAYAFADPGVLMTLTEVPEDKSIEDARAKLISILEDELTQTPITEQEVERAKQQILKQRELEAGETDRLAISLSEWAAQGDWRLYFLFRDVVESLTAEQVQQFAKRYLVRNNRTVGLFIPTETSERITIPESPNLIARLEDYKGREAIQQGEQFDPSPANIESRTERGKLDNGIEFALLPKQTRGGSVNLSLTLRFGTADAMINRLGAIELMGIMMTRGTEKLDYQAFQDELTRLRAELSINTVPGLLKVSLKTKREYLPEVIELLGQVLRSPRLDGSELEVLRRQIVTNLRQGSTMPESIAPRDVRRRLSPYGTDDIRYVQTVQEEIAMYENVSIDEINKAYQDLVGGNRGELAVVGDFDSSEIREQITTILGDWSSDIEYVRIDRPANDNIEGGLTEFNTPDKANAFYFSQSQMQLEDSSDEYAALVLGNYILGGGGLSSRLADRVRQQEGLSYGVRSGLTSRPKDNRVDFTIYAITNPENKDRLIEVIREEVERLRKDGVTAEELEKAQQAYLQSQVVRRTDDANLVGELLETMFMERTMEHAAKHAEQIKAATVDSVNAAIVKYIHWDRLVRSVAGEFEKAAE